MAHARQLGGRGVLPRAAVGAHGGCAGNVVWWDDLCAKTVIVGMLSKRCADIWRCWSVSNQSTGRMCIHIAFHLHTGDLQTPY